MLTERQPDQNRTFRGRIREDGLSLGTATFGGKGAFFAAWGDTGEEQATRLVDMCLDFGLNMFDSADIYSAGLAETILGVAIKGKRDRVIISTKATFRSGDGPNDVGSSRYHLINACEKALKHLGTNYIDIFHLHGFDARTPIEETLSALDDLVRAGKICYVGCSNFSGWHLMKSLAVAERYNLPRHVAHQAYYSLANREYENELMPLGLDQGVGAIVRSPLASGRIAGKIRRGQSVPESSRRGLRLEDGPFVEDGHLFTIIDAIDEIARETGKSVTQNALNWLLQRPTVASIIMGSRNETQLSENFGAIGWALTPEQVQRLDEASRVIPTYPYWHQEGFAERNPFPTL
jgi:aryl-alcohol dehydrogenase-like predicted oxidoreductase